VTTETETKPVLGSPPDQWPPLAHLIRKEDEPAGEGTVALCGTRLMGIDLGRLRNASGPICGKCLKVLRRELGG
jgi:hypothetical protein